MSRFANLSERLSADLPADPTRPEDEEDETPTVSKKEKDKDMSEEIDKAKAEGRSEGFKAANERMNAVFASEHYEGREAQAKAMLAKDMSAADIIDILAATPKVEQAAVSDDVADKAARDEMKSNIDANANSGVEAGSVAGASTSNAKNTAAVWDEAISAIAPASNAA